MEKTFAKVEELANSIKEYVNTSIEVTKLKAAEKASGIIANLIAGAIAAAVFLFFIGFASLGLAVALSEWIGNAWAGFLIVAGVYLLGGIIVWYGRGSIIQVPVMNALIQQLFKSDETDKQPKTVGVPEEAN